MSDRDRLAAIAEELQGVATQLEEIDASHLTVDQQAKLRDAATLLTVAGEDIEAALRIDVVATIDKWQGWMGRRRAS